MFEGGLKDHEIRELINKLNMELEFRYSYLGLPKCLREVISNIVTSYLEDNGLRRDKKDV